MQALLDSLQNFLAAGWSVITELFQLITAFAPLPLLIGVLAWVVFWTFGVNWVKMRQTMLQGGWIALLLIGVTTVLVWGSIDPPVDGQHNLLGLTVSNFVGKTIYVTALYCIMFLCGSVQLSGCCAGCCQFDEDEPETHAITH
jgi:hypothetical protein